MGPALLGSHQLVIQGPHGGSGLFLTSKSVNEEPGPRLNSQAGAFLCEGKGLLHRGEVRSKRDTS